MLKALVYQGPGKKQLEERSTPEIEGTNRRGCESSYLIAVDTSSVVL